MQYQVARYFLYYCPNEIFNLIISVYCFYFLRESSDQYAGSYMVYVAMGDYYAAIGDKPNAIINYKKSLAIEDIADIRMKLGNVQGK